MQPRRRLKPICILLTSVFAHGAIAQESSDGGAIPTIRISVFGQNQTRQVQNISRDDLIKAVPGSSPLNVLEKLPGVNFSSADTYGAYEWSTRLTVRGFNQNQLGFTLDDVPLGDMSYSNHNGLHISRAIATENIGRVILSQGTGALDTASTSNLGGTVQFYSVDPADQRGFSAAQSLGQNAARRTFLRFDSGRFDNGAKFDLSYVNQNTDKWKGSGQQRQEQVNAKVVSNFGENRLSAFVNYSDRKEIDYQDMSKEMVNRLGYKWDNYYPNWNAAINSAKGIWSRGETSVDDAYYAGSGLRKDWLTGATLDARMSDSLLWKTTLYHHSDKGAGLWFSPYTPSSPSVPVSLRTTEYDIKRSGVITALTWTGGIHEVNAGVWVEDNTFDQARRFYALGLNDPGRSPYDIPGNPLLTQWNYEFKNKTVQFHVQDTMKLSSQLTANAGFKSLSDEITAATLTGPDKSGSIKASKSFLPQVGLNFKLDSTNELFASIAQNMRAFPAAATGDSPFATSAAGFAAIRNTLKPETSTTMEAGWRHRQAGLETVLTVYHVDFKDRILGIQQGAGIVGNPTVLANVGKVQTNGAEAGLSWSPVRNLNWVNSISYNNSQYKDNFSSNGVLVPVSGKQVVDAPKIMFKSELGYDNGVYFGRIGANYTDKRYYTYLNDNSVDSYTLWNLSAGYRLKNLAFLRDFSVQLSINNLLNKQYFSTIGSNGFVTSDPTGANQTLLTGAPRTAFVTVAGKF
ncbi:MAG: TonB-dependent receptor [Betaproteobacteria bacterium]|nr:TonB-dependent receptor [Betaproteobacteria bacterium]